ncbi:MAG: hypothetical protein NTX07_01540, partial [Solirubrobacterales bacterium]|nr:hypothetical protein [Solirubrobacterales bacterium]
MHNFAVTATDPAGNTSAPATAAWTVDTAAPDKPTLGGSPDPNSPGVLTNSRRAEISYIAEPGATVTCSVDEAEYVSCGGSPKVMTGLGDGDHSLSVVATDASGKSSSPATATWTVDATAPAKPILSGTPAIWTGSGSASIGFIGDPEVAFVCSLDGEDFDTCGSSPKVLSGLADGHHALRVIAVDPAGNSSATATAGWNVDGMKPARPAISAAPRTPHVSRSGIVTFNGDPGAVFQCSVDNRSYRSCSSPLRLLRMKDGRHRVAIRQVDVLTKAGPARSVAWVTDTAIPRAPRITGLGSAIARTQSARLKFRGVKGRSFQCRLDDRAWRRCAANFTLRARGLDTAWYDLSVRQVSKLGNAGPETVRSFEVTPSVRLSWTSLEYGELSLGLQKPEGCRAGRLGFDLWGSGVGRIHIQGNSRCGTLTRRLATGHGVEGRITPGGVT